MFTGVGGFELGIERATMEEIREKSKRWGNSKISCVGFSEINKYANQLLAKRFPNIPNFGDCTKIEADKLPDFDMLCGGFPCQSFSIAGKRRGFQDTRGTMFFEVARIVKAKRPKIVFLENVKGLLNHNKGETFKVILETLDELGYETQWMVFNSKFFGVPQNRERVFIIGSLRGERRPEILPFQGNHEAFKEQVVANTIDKNYGKGIDNHGQRTMIYNVYGGFNEGIREQIEICPTIRTSKGGGHLHMVKQGASIRKLTPTECERLQGFPDGWTEGFSDTQRYNMMGNAVTVDIIQAITSKLWHVFHDKRVKE